MGIDPPNQNPADVPACSAYADSAKLSINQAGGSNKRRPFTRLYSFALCAVCSKHLIKKNYRHK